MTTSGSPPPRRTSPTPSPSRRTWRAATREPEYTWNIDEVTVESLAEVFTQIDEWQDTRDFQMMYLHWVLALGQGDTESTQLSPEVIEAIRERVLANRYRYDDPLPEGRIDNLWYWSENHQAINLIIEYLGGQRYPDDVFAVTGLTGAEHMARAKPGILEWVRERGQLGFFEWHSNVYMLKNITPLHLLAEQADDPELVLAAAMGLDLCVLDMASHLQNGCYTAPRGGRTRRTRCRRSTRTRSAPPSSSSTTRRPSTRRRPTAVRRTSRSARGTDRRSC